MQHLEDLNMTGQSISNQISTEDQEKVIFGIITKVLLEL